MNWVSYISYILLILFWISVFICFYKPSYLLKYSVIDCLDRIKEKASDLTIFQSVHGIQSNRQKIKLMKDLTESLVYLKNITILGRGENISSELMLEELADFSPKLSKTFLSMARNISLNEKEDAANALYIEIGTTYARDIGAFLASWEDIPQKELLSSIEAYIKVMREEQLTKQKAKDELISDLVYLPVVLNCMLVLLNFIYVSYFIEQQELLEQLFNF